MSLKGNIKTMPLADLVRYLVGRNSTGTLELTSDGTWKRLYFEKGRLISSGSSEPSEYLGHFLISEGMITEDQLTQAMEVQQKTKVMLGKILVMIGAVTEEEMVNLLVTKCKEATYSMFFWAEGEFEFFDNQLPAVRLIPLSLEMEPLLEEGMRRLNDYKRLRELYPSREVRFAKTGFSVSDPIFEDPFARRVYDFIDGTRSVAEITMQTHGADYKVLSCLEKLKKRNLISIISAGNESAPQEMPRLPREQMIQSGKSKLAFGKWEEAINLFKYVVKQDEDHAEAAELLARAESSLLQSLYEEALPPDAVPKLSRPIEALTKERLNSEESFMVTRVNGRWDVKSILTITPLREVDALRILKRLLDRNIIAI